MDLTRAKISSEISGSTFRNNSSPYEQDGVNSATINIKNLLFSDSTLNSSCLFGGGIYITFLAIQFHNPTDAC